LEGSWLLALYYDRSTPRLLVLNTLLPQRDPRSWRILGLPPVPGLRYRAQHEEALTEYPEFSVDPTQRIFAVFPFNEGRAFITPVELLMRRLNSARADPYIPPEEWMEDAIAVHFRPTAHTLQIYDTKVLALCSSPDHPEDWGVEMYDLSKLGRKDVQVQEVDGKVGGGCRRVISIPKWFARCEMGDGTLHTTQFVGNKVLCVYVSPLYVRKGSCRIQCCTRPASAVAF